MRVLAFLAAALFLAAAATGPWPGWAGSAVAVLGAPAAEGAKRVRTADELEQLMLAEINRVRRERGLSQLRLSEDLEGVARKHSLSMARKGFFRHDSYDGTPFWKRVKVSYAPAAGAYWSVGENMAWRSPGLSAAQTVEMWLESPPHRKTLLGAMWREVGIGSVYAPGAPGVYAGLDVTIVTVDFGARR